jgi:hypothetical protein
VTSQERKERQDAINRRQYFESEIETETRTADLNGSLELKKDWLGDEDFAGLCTQILDFELLQLDLFSWPVSPHCKKEKNR